MVKDLPLLVKHPTVAEIRKDFEENPAYLKCVCPSVLL